MKSIWVKFTLATALMTTISGCTIVDDAGPTPSVAPESTSTQLATTYPSALGTPDTSLVVTVLKGNSMRVSTRHLACNGSSAVVPTNFPDADTACKLIADSNGLFTKELAPTDNEQCRGTGNQVVADVIGESKGERIQVSFQRDNDCNAKVWDGLTPLIGRG